MNKRIYQTPTTKVVQVQQCLQMLQASSNGVQATMSSSFEEVDLD